MRRLAAGVLLASLLIAGAGPVLSQEPSAEPGPEGWSMLSTDDGESLSFMYLDFPVGWRPFEERLSVAYDLWTDDWCETRSATVHDLTRAAAVYADAWMSHYADSTDVVDISRTVIELPAGEALRLDYRRTDRDEDQTHYLVSDDKTLYILVCAGASRPADGWLPIAESLVTGNILTDLPDGWEERIPFDARVPMPMFGFAVEFPLEWDIEPIGIVPPDDRWLSIAETFAPFTGFIAAKTANAVCIISDYTPVAEVAGWATVAEMASDRLAWSIEVLDLPAGRVARQERESDGGLAQTVYTFTDGRRWFGMSCGALEGVPPDDDWLSIAETFEFLPAEE